MPSLLELFFIFFKIGLFTFGGGYSMIPMIVEETSNFDVLNESQIIDFIAISESTPGPFAINIATFIGYNQQGFFGAIVATFGVILPSFIIILLLVNILEKVKDNRYFKSIIQTIMPLIIGLIAATVLDISLVSLANVDNIINIKNEFKLNLTTLVTLFIIVLVYYFIKLFKKKKPTPILIIVLCAGLGVFISYLR